MTKTFAEKTSAADKWVGFDYQYYYFIDKLLNMKTGDTVGLEVLDDVHAKIGSKYQLLFQLKHTTKFAAGGQPINLTSLDEDLWKTMSNWSSLICDPGDSRSEVAQQIDFVRRSEFHLVSNKSDAGNNLFVESIKKLQAGLCDFNEVKKVLADLHAATDNSAIKTYIANVLSRDDKVNKRFFYQIRFELNCDEILRRIRQSIAEKAIAPEDVDEVFEKLDSNIREDNFINIKSGVPICISFDDFMTKYRKIFTTSRKETLKYYEYEPVIPKDLLAQKFVKQLIYIGDVGPGDIETIANFTVKKMRAAQHLFEWHKTGQLLVKEVEAFHKDVIDKWENKFRRTFSPGKMPKDINSAAVDLLHDLREISFVIDSQTLTTEISNGELYNLSDLDRVGWHPDWNK